MLINILNEYLCWKLASCTSYTMCLSLSLSPYLFHTRSSHRKRPILALPPQHLLQGKLTSSSHPATANTIKHKPQKSPLASLCPCPPQHPWDLQTQTTEGTEDPSLWDETEPTSNLWDSRLHVHLSQTSMRRGVPSKHKCPVIFKAS